MIYFAQRNNSCGTGLIEVSLRQKGMTLGKIQLFFRLIMAGKAEGNCAGLVLLAMLLLISSPLCGVGYAQLSSDSNKVANSKINDTSGNVVNDVAGKKLYVRKIRIEGNKAVSSSAILANVHSHSDAFYDAKLVSEDARRIMLMPQIYNVKWRIDKVPGDKSKVDIVFVVTETPQVKAVSILGNKHIKTSVLMDKLRFSTGDFLDVYLVQAGREAILQAYHDKGYYFASVTINEQLLKTEQRVLYLVVEGPKLRIKKVVFEGNKQVKRSTLLKKIKTRGYFPIFRKGILDDDKLKSDRLALETYYHDEGYLDTRVFIDKKFNDTRTRVVVHFIIEEGPRYRVSSISFVGNHVFTDKQLSDSFNLKVGDYLTKKRRIFAQRGVERLYGKNGYIYVTVKIVPEYTNKAGDIDVVFNITENKKYLLGRLIVQGNYKTKDKVVRRAFDHFDFLPGHIYNTYAVDRSQRRLKGQGFFEDINVAPVGNEQGKRDALATVKEARTGLVLFGVGVDTNSGLIGQISLAQRNFDIANTPKSLGEFFRGESFVGAGQRLRLNFEPGTEVTRGNIQFYEPYLFDQPYYFNVNLFSFRRWRESYLEQRLGGIVTLGRRFKNDWSVETSLRGERIRVSDLDESHGVISAPVDVQDVEGGNNLTSIKFGVGRDTTDSMFRPTEGYKLTAAWEQVGALGGDFSFAALTAGATLFKTVYMDIAERKTVWAGQVNAARIVGDAPVFERYYAGGIGSIRGFDYRGVSPRAGKDDDPIGSDWLFTANTEISHPLYEDTIYGKLFLDSGVVSTGCYRVTAGFGFELLIPQLFQMIPMHFDFGFPIHYDDQDDKQIFSFSFGMNF